MIDTTFDQYKIIRETVNLYGDKQYMIAVEEMAELMQIPANRKRRLRRCGTKRGSK